MLGMLNLGGAETILILGVLVFMFGGPLVVAGVIYWIVRSNQTPPSSARPFTVDAPPVASAAPDLEQQLRTLAKLKDEGVITEDDFNLKKKAILGI